MLNGTDYRIKICAQLSQQDFVLAHKLFAQLYYKYYSSNNPLVLRDAPTPTISSAVAGAFGILSTNLDYLKSQVTFFNFRYISMCGRENKRKKLYSNLLAFGLTRYAN
jgi:hypothetical protein